MGVGGNSSAREGWEGTVCLGGEVIPVFPTLCIMPI